MKGRRKKEKRKGCKGKRECGEGKKRELWGQRKIEDKI